MAGNQWTATEPAPAQRAEPTPEEEPIVMGTLFFMILLLMLIFGFWGLMYVTLLNR